MRPAERPWLAQQALGRAAPHPETYIPSPLAHKNRGFGAIGLAGKPLAHMPQMRATRCHGRTAHVTRATTLVALLS